MANHITNQLTLSGPIKNINELLLFIKGEEDIIIDFDKIIPPPQNMFNESIGERELKYCIENNIPTWLTWKIKNWGMSLLESGIWVGENVLGKLWMLVRKQINNK